MERETGKFFDQEFVLELVSEGKFLKASKYLEGFVLLPSHVAAPGSSAAALSSPEEQARLKIFHTLHLQRYLEAIFHHERYEAYKILESDLRYMLERANFDHYKDLVDLLSSDRIP